MKYHLEVIKINEDKCFCRIYSFDDRALKMFINLTVGKFHSGKALLVNIDNPEELRIKNRVLKIKNVCLETMSITLESCRIVSFLKKEDTVTQSTRNILIGTIPDNFMQIINRDNITIKQKIN